MKVVIVEDEKLAAVKLEQLLIKADPEIRVVKKLESVGESVNWFSAHSDFDLVFMDIQLDDGISFEIFDAVKVDVPVIFTTAFNEYAIRAFKVNSVDYLLKPIEENALSDALKKYKELYIEDSSFKNDFARLFEQFNKSYKERFLVKIGLHYQSVPVNEISCFFVEERCSFLKTKSGKNYDLDFSLDQLQKMVNPDRFFRINRNYLVNINFINDILGYSSSRLKLKLENFTNDNLIVSRDKVTEFKSWMDR